MNSYLAVKESIMNTSEYKSLYNSLHRYPDQLFEMTEYELDNIIEYDVINIMASYYKRMNSVQKKYVVELMESGKWDKQRV